MKKEYETPGMNVMTWENLDILTLSQGVEGDTDIDLSGTSANSIG